MSMGEPLYPNVKTPEPVEKEPADFRHLLPVDSEIVAPRAPASRLQDAAETVGSAVGQAVNAVRELPEHLRLQQRLADMKQRFIVIKGRAQEDALDKAGELKEKVGVKWADTRTRASRLARQYPFGVVLGAAGAAFILGVALRIWRDHD
jgi:hypothetical protein